jgi:hypothetical protein
MPNVRLQDLTLFLCTVMLLLVMGGVAWAGLFEAHQQALANYKKTKDPSTAIKILKEAGIDGAMEQKPAGMREAAYVNLLNDYGFFLAETADTSTSRGLAIDVLQKVIQISPARAVAYRNLGDVYVKEIDANQDSNARREMRMLALEQYQKYADLLAAKKQTEKMPAQVRAFLDRARAHGNTPRQYELVMNKEKDTASDVCTHMLGLYNTDLGETSQIQYSKHPEFLALSWKPMSNLIGGLERNEGQFLLSRFDIDNDGKNDLVVKSQWSLHGTLGDQLDMYGDRGDSPPIRDKFDVEDLKKGEGSIGAVGTYYLRGITGQERGHMVVPPFILQPFLYKGHAYISMTDFSAEFEEAIYETDVRYEKWLVVATYTGGNELQDICYFQLLSASDRKKQRASKGR